MQSTLGSVKEGILVEVTVCPEGTREISQADKRGRLYRHKE